MGLGLRAKGLPSPIMQVRSGVGHPGGLQEDLMGLCLKEKQEGNSSY